MHFLFIQYSYRMTLALEDFLPLFTGKLSAQSAFLTKKLKIQGEIDKALKLEGFLKQVGSIVSLKILKSCEVVSLFFCMKLTMCDFDMFYKCFINAPLK